MDSEPWHDKKYYEHAQRTHRSDLHPEDLTMRMQEDHLEAHQEEDTQDRATQEEKTRT